MAISDLLYKIALARGGVGQESTLDKLNKTFQTIGGIGKQMGDYGSQQQANQLNALKLQEAKANIAKAEYENQPTENLFPKETVTQPRSGYTAGQEAPVYPKGFPEQWGKTPLGQIKSVAEAMKAFNPNSSLDEREVQITQPMADASGGAFSVGDIATWGAFKEANKTYRTSMNPTVEVVDPETGKTKFTKRKLDPFAPKTNVKPMSDKTKDIFSGLMDSLSAIETSAGYVSGDKVRVGEGTNLYKLSNIPGAGLARGLAGTPEENELMANLTKAQSSFYKAQTGAQRGMKEIAFLAPAMPQAGSQNKENFLATAKSSAKSIADNFVRAYRLAEKQGQDMSEYKPTYEQIISSYGEPSPIGGINKTAGVETGEPSVSNEPIIAENESGVRIQSTDGGKTWKPVLQQ